MGDKEAFAHWKIPLAGVHIMPWMFLNLNIPGSTMAEAPVSLSKKQRELMEEFAQIGKGEKNSPESSGFFAKVKDLFG